mmetsp:Transcript_3217/g.4944  ORF Transcript_3217/g.4944 Transcript_3217/m.4944 type:complete len:219 (+) Transcript_3217:1417-2073(+)
MMNGGSRFIFSHTFVEMPVVQMVDVLEGKGTRYRLRKTKSKKGVVKLYPDCFADNYGSYRSETGRNILLQSQLMRYERHFYTFKEIDGDKAKTLQSKIDGLKGKDILSEAEQKELRKLKALLEKEKEARYFKLKPQTYTAEVSVSICPEVVRDGNTRAPFKFLQFSLNTNDATTGHKLQGMSKDHLIVTSWDGISRWDNPTRSFHAFESWRTSFCASH